MLPAWQNKWENQDALQQILPARADTSPSSPWVGWGCLPFLEGPQTADGKYSPSWIEGSTGKQSNCRWAPAVPGSDKRLCHSSCSPCLGAGLARRASSAKTCAPSKGSNGARVRDKKGHSSCSLTFWVCCLRKQWKCCNVCNASLARLFLRFFLH